MDVAIGSVAGITAFTATMPADFAKQWIQGSHGAAHVRHVVRTHGFQSLWSGAIVGNAVIAPQMAIKFGVFNRMRRQEIGPIQAGFVAGLCDGAFLGPVAAIQAHQQRVPGSTLRNSARHLWRTANLGILTIPMALRNAVYTACVFGPLRPVESRLFRERTLWSTWCTAFLLNVPASLLCSPFDVWRAIQVEQLATNQPVRLVRFNPFAGLSTLMLAFALRFPLTIMLNQVFIQEAQRTDWDAYAQIVSKIH